LKRLNSVSVPAGPAGKTAGRVAKHAAAVNGGNSSVLRLIVAAVDDGPRDPTENRLNDIQELRRRGQRDEFNQWSSIFDSNLIVVVNVTRSVAQTLSEFAADPKWMATSNGTPAFTLVLHTWTQDLRHHIHVHAVMACGVLDHDRQWRAPARKPDFLFPVRALSRVFRGRFGPANPEMAWSARLCRRCRRDVPSGVRWGLAKPCPLLQSRRRLPSMPRSSQ